MDSFDYKFCPICSSPLTQTIESGITRKSCTQADCEYVHWNNPTPVLAAIAHRNDEVILIQAIGWPKHWYSLVTGFHEAGETAEEGILREVKEEIGLNGEVKSLIGVYSFLQMNQVIIAYDVLVEEGEITLDLTELVDHKLGIVLQDRTLTVKPGVLVLLQHQVLVTLGTQAFLILGRLG